MLTGYSFLDIYANPAGVFWVAEFGHHVGELAGGVICVGF